MYLFPDYFYILLYAGNIAPPHSIPLPLPLLFSDDPKIVTFPNRAGEVVGSRFRFQRIFQDAK